MTKIYSNSIPKIRKSSIFGPKLKHFIFCTKLCSKTNQRALISNMTMVVQNCCPKHPIKASLVPNSRILILHETLLLDKLEGIDYKYDSSFSTFQPKDPNRAFLVLRIVFSFWIKPYVFANSRVLIKNLIIVFIKLQPKNT